MIEVRELTTLGLSETEAKTYLALLELGSGTVTSITHRADITRTLGYHSLDRLVELGLIEQKKNSHPTEFHVKHPKLILNYLEKEKGLWESRIHTAQSLLPKLESSYTMLGRPYLANCIGSDEVFDLYRILYTSENSLLSLLNPALLSTEDLSKTFALKSHNVVGSITCIQDTVQNREVMSTIEVSNASIQWIKIPEISLDLQSIETIVSSNTLYTITKKEQELYAECITHKTTAQGMYTLLYTLINK